MGSKQLHKKWRIQFRNGVFARDKFRCKFCDVKENLDAHHITDRHEMPNGGYVIENGISLCEKHHLQAELYHISNKTTGITGMMPDDLYRIIGSSYTEAFQKSEQLK